MSGLGAIIDWVNDEIQIDPTDAPQDVFEVIDDEFEKDNRSGLANILKDDLPQFMEYIESRLEAPTEDRERLEKRISDLESQIEAAQIPREEPKDRDTGRYNGLTKGSQLKLLVDNVLGRVIGVNLFGSGFQQTINVDGIANKYTGFGLASMIYGMIPIKGLPHKGKAKTLGKKVLVAGVLGGLFDAPEFDTRNRVQAQRSAPRLMASGGQLTTT